MRDAANNVDQAQIYLSELSKFWYNIENMVRGILDNMLDGKQTGLKSSTTTNTQKTAIMQWIYSYTSFYLHLFCVSMSRRP